MCVSKSVEINTKTFSRNLFNLIIFQFKQIYVHVHATNVFPVKVIYPYIRQTSQTYKQDILFVGILLIF